MYFDPLCIERLKNVQLHDKMSTKLQYKYMQNPKWSQSGLLVFRLESLYNLQLLICSCQPSPDPQLAKTLLRYPSVLNVLFFVSAKCQMQTHYEVLFFFLLFFPSLHYKSVNINQKSVSCLCRKLNCKPCTVPSLIKAKYTWNNL